MPPSVNHYWGHRVVGRYVSTYLTKQAKEYKAQVKHIVGYRKPLQGRLQVRVGLQFATKRKADIDNRLKGLLDALTEANVLVDDSQVDCLVVERQATYKGGRVLVEITQMEQAIIDSLSKETP